MLTQQFMLWPNVPKSSNQVCDQIGFGETFISQVWFFIETCRFFLDLGCLRGRLPFEELDTTAEKADEGDGISCCESCKLCGRLLVSCLGICPTSPSLDINDSSHKWNWIRSFQSVWFSNFRFSKMYFRQNFDFLNIFLPNLVNLILLTH